MQKINIISCCAECSACKDRRARIHFCEKKQWWINGDSGNPINSILTGFPDWCPLETMQTADGANADYRKEVKKIMKIMADDASTDALAEASHYLNSVIENAKKTAEAD